MKIEFRKQIDSDAAPWQPLTNIDELIWNGVFTLRVTDDNGSHGLPFHFANDDIVTIVVKDHTPNASLPHTRTTLQEVTHVECATGKILTCTRTRYNSNGTPTWNYWTLATEEDAVIEIPKATPVSLGAVIVGDGLAVDADGKLSVAGKSIGEERLTSALNEKINVAATKANATDFFVQNSGLALHYGALLQDDAPYPGTDLRVHTDKILSGGEQLVVNDGYVISTLKIFDGEQEIAYANNLGETRYILDAKGLHYQFEFSKLNMTPFTDDELPQVIKAYQRRPIVWSSTHHINHIVAAGTYNIVGQRTNSADGLPIANAASGHSINARLVVLDSSIPAGCKESDKCITQILTLSNRVGGDGDIYVRTGRAADTAHLIAGNGWGTWGKLQQNIEVGQITSLNAYIDNGIYSGVYTNGTTFFETFVMVVINNYAVAAATGTVRSITQLKYAVDTNGTFCYHARTGQGADTVEWGEWRDLDAVTTDRIQDGAIAAFVEKTIPLKFVRVIGRIINPASGVFASVEGAGYLGVIPVKSGEKYLYSGRATQYNVGVAAYDENRAYLYPIICNVDNAVIKKDVCVDEPFTIPEGVAYIAVGTRYQESNPVSIKRVYSPKELVDRKVPQLVSYDIIDGYVVNTANGNVGAVSGSAVGSFIKVTEGEEFLITAKWGSQSGIAGYDKDKNYIIRLADATLSTFYSAAEVSDYLIRIPQGVEYIRGCTTDAVNYPLKVVKLVSIEDLTEKIPLCQNQFSYAWFGDSISQFGIPENVERKLGSSILDCSFAGAPLTYSTEQYQGTGFMTIASCIKNSDYTQIENALQLQSGAGTDITNKLVNLQHIKDANWKAISHFVVMAGTNDLSFSGATIDNIKAGLRQAFKDVISAYPHITIYFVSPPFRGNINSAAGNGLDLLEINEAIEEVCKEFNFPFFDFFHNCGVNQYNKGYYLDAQELHPNANGLALWSSKLANWLKSL